MALGILVVFQLMFYRGFHFSDQINSSVIHVFA